MSHAVALADSVDDIHLILHQRNKRRYNDCRSVHQERRQLVAQRLTATCRHQHESVVTGEQVTYYPFLITLELVETEQLLQFLCKV